MPHFRAPLCAVVAMAVHALAAAAQAPTPPTDTAPSITVGTADGPVRLDGVLDDAAWAAAGVIDGLTMIEPDHDIPESHRTTIKVLVRPTEVYIGVVCEDEADGIVSFTKQRDGTLRNEDHLRVVLGTFLDGRSGYVFEINPGGARYDALVNPGGDTENANWDGIWDAATHRDARGWSAEFWIPTQSLSFARGLDRWHFNVERRIQRLQETARWAGARLDWKVTQTSRAGVLQGLPDLSQGRGLSIRPAVTGGGGVNGPGQPVDGTADVSLDVTQRLGPNLTSSLSIRTDFAESEVDTRRTNLTRFPLFFPETRTFFLEGSDTFQFGLGLGNDVIPFFSRRVGLVSGREVPILVGGKLNGRAGRTELGAVVTRTRALSGVAPESTMGAARVKQNFWRESSVGLIATVGDPLGRAGSWLAGPDITLQTSRFRGNKNLRAGAWALAMGREGARGDRTASGFRVDYPNDLWNMFWSTMRVGDGFDPSLGFVPRAGMYYHRLTIEHSPRFNNGWLRQMQNEFQSQLWTDLQGRWESYRVQTAPLNWRFNSGDRVEFNYVPTGETLSRPFAVADGVSIPVGRYTWTRWRLEGQAAAKRPLSGQLTWWFGGFYGGTLNQVIWTGTWHPSALVALEVTGERDTGDLPQGRFVQQVSGTRVRFNVSPDMQISSYWQYDLTSRSVGSNTKLRWTFRPLGDLFVIYNHNVRERLDRWALDSNQLLVKLQYAFRY